MTRRGSVRGIMYRWFSIESSGGWVNETCTNRLKMVAKMEIKIGLIRQASGGLHDAHGGVY